MMGRDIAQLAQLTCCGFSGCVGLISARHWQLYEIVSEKNPCLFPVISQEKKKTSFRLKNIDSPIQHGLIN
jgi:hypothetical protein